MRTHTTVTSVRPLDDGYLVATTNGDLRCRSVVLASGACNLPSVPALRQAVPALVECVTALDYRNPDQLPDGGVLVVGASATGVQLADEIHRSGRPVTLSVGEHVRLPRTYRGRDVLWWMDASGVWNQRYDEIDDLTRAPQAAVAAAGRHAGARRRSTSTRSARPASRSSGGSPPCATAERCSRAACAISSRWPT